MIFKEEKWMNDLDRKKKKVFVFVYLLFGKAVSHLSVSTLSYS